MEAFDAIEQEIRQKWEDAPARDTEGRERLWIMLKLLKNVRSHLSEVMVTGKLKRLALEQEQERTLLEQVKAWADELF